MMKAGVAGVLATRGVAAVLAHNQSLKQHGLVLGERMHMPHRGALIVPLRHTGSVHSTSKRMQCRGPTIIIKLVF